MSSKVEAMAPPLRLASHARAISGIWLGSVFGAGLAFMTLVVAARTLPPEAYGLFATALAGAALLAPVAGFGVSQLWLQVFGRDPFSGASWLPGSLTFCKRTLGLCLGLVVAWVLLGPHSRYTGLVFLLVFPVISGQLATELVSSTLQIQRRYFGLALWQVAPHLSRFLLVIGLYFALDGELTALLLMLGFGGVGTLIAVAGYRILRNFVRTRLDTEAGGACLISVKQVALEGWPFGAAVLLNLIYYQGNIVLIKYLVGDVAAGVYSIAFNVMAAVYLLPIAIFQKFLLPKIHVWVHSSPEKVAFVNSRGTILMIFGGSVAAILVCLIGVPVVPILFGQGYEAVGAPLKILAVSAPFMFVAIGNGAILATSQSMRIKIVLMMIVALTNLSLNVVLISSNGVVGAAVATVLSNALLAGLYFCVARVRILKRAY